MTRYNVIGFFGGWRIMMMGILIGLTCCKQVGLLIPERACTDARQRAVAVIYTIDHAPTVGGPVALELASWMPVCDGETGAQRLRVILRASANGDMTAIRQAVLDFATDAVPAEAVQ